MTKKKPKPDLVHPGRWTVREKKRGGDTNFEKKLMRAPFDASNRSAITRRHEMAHAKFTPEDWHEQLTSITDSSNAAQAFQGAEDLRLEVELEKKGIPQADLVNDDVLESVNRIYEVDKESADALTAAVKYLCSAPYPYLVRKKYMWLAEERLKERGFGAHTTDALNRLLTHVESKISSASSKRRFQMVLEAAEKIGEFFDELEELEMKETPEPQEHGDGGLEGLDGWDEAEEGGHTWTRKGMGRWSPMEEVMPPLRRPDGFVARERKAAPRERGLEVGHIERWCTDRRVFKGKASRHGNRLNILIDMSGSMGLDGDDIERLMMNAPGCRIYGYVSFDTYKNPGHCYQGTLYRLAEDGQRVGEDEYKTGGSNGVDGPALRRICEFEGPKVWVSDRQVNGPAKDCGEDCDKHHRSHMYSNLVEEVRRIVKRHNVKVVGTVDELVTYLESRHV